MTSREITALVKSRHADVCKSIDKLSESGVIHGYTGQPYTSEQNGQTYYEYYISKRDSYVIVAQFSPEFTAALVDRWQELENKPVDNPLLQLANAVMTAQAIIQDQSQKLLIAEPKAAAFDLITNSENELCLRDAAKHLQVKPSKLNNFMQQQGWIFKGKGSGNWTAYQRRIEQGFMVHRRVTFTRASGDSEVSWQPLVTPEGIKFLSLYPSIKEMQTP